MPLRTYLRRIQDLLESLPSIATYSLSFDERSSQTAFLHGRIYFTDSSVLDFKEFLLADREVRKVKYGYHWSAPNGSLRFRYDNAADPAARHLTSYPHHKHTPGKIEETEEPTLASVLEEAANLLAAESLGK
jgi:hypothetical protein